MCFSFLLGSTAHAFWSPMASPLRALMSRLKCSKCKLLTDQTIHYIIECYISMMKWIYDWETTCLCAASTFSTQPCLTEKEMQSDTWLTAQWPEVLKFFTAQPQKSGQNISLGFIISWCSMRHKRLALVGLVPKKAKASTYDSSQHENKSQRKQN